MTSMTSPSNQTCEQCGQSIKTYNQWLHDPCPEETGWGGHMVPEFQNLPKIKGNDLRY